MEKETTHLELEDTRRKSNRINKGQPPAKYGQAVSFMFSANSCLPRTPDQRGVNPINSIPDTHQVERADNCSTRNILEKAPSNASMRDNINPNKTRSNASNRSKIESLKQQQILITQNFKEAQEEEQQLQKLRNMKFDLEQRKLEAREQELIKQRKAREEHMKKSLELEQEINEIVSSCSVSEKSSISPSDRTKRWVNRHKQFTHNEDYRKELETRSVIAGKPIPLKPAHSWNGVIPRKQNNSLRMRENPIIREECVLPNTNIERDNVLSEAFKSLRNRQVRDLPTYRGSIREWPLFYGEFLRSTEEFNISKNENLRRLNKALEKEARQCVLQLLNSPDNVNQIINVLRMNYGRPEWVIANLVEDLKSFPNIKDEHVESVRNFFNIVSGTVATIKNMKGEYYLMSPELLDCVVKKLPSLMKNNWGHKKASISKEGILVNLETFSLWLEDELEALYATYNPAVTKRSYYKDDKKVVVMTHAHTNESSRKCPACKSSSHSSLYECSTFKEQSIDDRRKLVRNSHLCFNCLKYGHGSAKCLSKSKCKTCGLPHNTLLHKNIPVRRTNEENTAPVMINFKKSSNVLLRCGKVRIKGPNGIIETFALFDEASTASQIETELASKLGLEGPVVPITYRWTRDISSHDDNSKLLNAEIAGPSFSSKFYKLRDVRTVDNLSLPTIQFDLQKILSLYPQVDVDKLLNIQNVKPSLLIGSNNSGLIVPLKTIPYALYGLQLCHCHLGWTIHGNIDPEEPIDDHFSFHIYTMESECENDSLSTLIKDSYKMEDFGIKIANEKPTDDDKRAIEIMEQTIKRTDDRFEIGHLYRFEDFSFPKSKATALKRLSYIERKMDKDKQFSEQYCEKIQDYVNKGYARKLEPHETKDTPKTWYLPHFGVTNPNKPGKFRLVMDAKAKSQGYSLNDLLLQGPDFVPPLIAVLWRARLRKIAFMADIQEMFHQVLIREQDRDSQRFLWRGTERNKEPDTYIMNVMIFGAVSSPSVAQFVKNYNAKELEASNPELGILRAITKQHYVDDYFDSCDSEESAIQLCHNVIKGHEQGGFKLVKFVSNSKSVIESLPDDLKAETGKNIYGEKVLGLYWNIDTDEFVFPMNFEKFDEKLIDGTKIPTKRLFLKFMMSIYDPLGFLCPLVVKLKIIFQELWRLNVQWDQEVPSGIFEKWKAWLEEAKNLNQVKIPRCYFPESKPFKTAELYIFCDAGDKAYSTVAYIRIVQEPKIYVSQVSGKIKVAPLKPMTIPRLELQGAVAASQLADTVKKELEITITKRRFYTDSKVVLNWLSTKEKLNSFVGSRVGKILEVSEVVEWFWISSKFNVADLSTKELPISHETLKIWQSGPEFLRLNETDWPISNIPELNETEFNNFHVELEPVTEHIHLVTYEDEIELPDISRFSEYFKLIRTTAYYLKMRDILQMKKTQKPKEFKINVHNMNEAKMMWIRKTQSIEFKQEIQDLTTIGYVSKKSRLYTYSPFLKDGIIRLNGRIQDGNFEQNNPIILPSSHLFTKLLIKSYHIANIHMGIETVVNDLRLKYRILNCRSAVKKIFHECITCKEKREKPQPVMMGQLPEERTKPVQYPFTYVGIDYFGPIQVKFGRKLMKHWVALMTCLTTRAVHLEIVPSLNTSSCIMAINRFICLRGIPKKIFSDNGTNFVGANNELKTFIRNIDQEEIKNKLSLKDIEWTFITPGAPHKGGCWERLVRSVKNGLFAMLNTQHPSYEVLNTALCEAMNVINNRPITHVSNDPHEAIALTPNHLLLGRVNHSQYGQKYDESDVYGKHIWKSAQVYADRFWKRWIKEYRPELIKRTKWYDDRNEIKIKSGDVVLIVDENLPRGIWPKGIVEKVFPGRDNKVRSVHVRTASGLFIRPVTKIVILLNDGDGATSGPGENVKE